MPFRVRAGPSPQLCFHLVERCERWVEFVLAPARSRANVLLFLHTREIWISLCPSRTSVGWCKWLVPETSGNHLFPVDPLHLLGDMAPLLAVRKCSISQAGMLYACSR